jgi:hypothetical protein
MPKWIIKIYYFAGICYATVKKIESKQSLTLKELYCY